LYEAAGDRAGELDRPGHALDPYLAAEADLAVSRGVGARRVKRDLRVLVDVEEVRGLEVAVAVLLAGVDRVDRVDVSGALKHGGVAGGVDRALEAAERAAHGGDSHVLDGEADAGVGGIYVVDAGRNAVGGEAGD
jgi:hypothetical protein